MNKIFETLTSFTGATLALMFVILVFFVARRIFNRKSGGSYKNTFTWQLVAAIIIFIGLLIIVVTLPIDREVKVQIISLIGILLSAALALSSTTIFSNAFAGIMNSTIKNFNLGDLIKVDKYFGRVSKKGLFHTEIQTEDRNLTSIPNLFIANNPVNITRESGTIISVTVSLGYDIQRKRIEACLLEAAKNAGLKDVFVFITSLGDFSVSYKIHGLLEDIDNYFTAQSQLKKEVMKSLHKAKIEIVSPAFMNQRQVSDTVFIPRVSRKSDESEPKTSPEKIIFDKAMQAEALESKTDLLNKIDSQLAELKIQADESGKNAKKEKILDKITRLEQLKSSISKRVKEDKSKLDEID